MDNPKSSQVNVTQVGASNSDPNGNTLVFCSAHNTPAHTILTDFSFFNSHSAPWIIDSKATDHISSSLKYFQIYFKIKPVTVNLPNGSLVTAQYLGTIKFPSGLILHSVLYVPNFKFNLISISKLISVLSYKFIFSGDFCEIQDVISLRTIGLAKLQGGLYHLMINKERCSPTTNPFINFTTSTPVTSSNLWHFRLGHLSGKRLNVLSQNFPFIPKHTIETCDVCHLAKQRRLSYSTSLSRASKIFELIHLDIWGPFSKISINGHKYFLTILDDYSRYTWVILLKSKAEVQMNIQNFVALVENQFDTKVKIMRSDNGPEFFMKDFYASKGILHQRSCVETPQQNGRVKRKHQHILNVARALMFPSHIPSNFWSFAINHAVYLINRVPSPIINNKTPFELLYNELPNFETLKVFGCLCYASTHSTHRNKFDPRSRRGVFLGYQSGMKGYIVLDLDNKEILISRNVLFDEMHFPFLKHNQTHTKVLSRPTGPSHFFNEPNLSTSNNAPLIPLEAHPHSWPISKSNVDSSSIEPTPSPSPATPCPSSSESLDILPAPPPRRSTRSRHPPPHFVDYHCNLLASPCQSSSRCSYPLSSVLNYSSLSPPHRSFLLSLSTELEPSDYAEASDIPCWQ